MLASPLSRVPCKGGNQAEHKGDTEETSVDRPLWEELRSQIGLVLAQQRLTDSRHGCPGAFQGSWDCRGQERAAVGEGYNGEGSRPGCHLEME